MPDLLAAALSPWLGLAWGGYLVAMVVWVILQRREPAATLSWVLTLALMPFVGFAVYYLIGPQRLQRRRMRRAQSRAAIEQTRRPVRIVDDLDARLISSLAERSGGRPLSTCTKLELLVDGEATFEALLAAIAAARDHVHLEYYIVRPDRSGNRLRDALIERARAGVEVRLLVDAVGGMDLGSAWVASLRSAGVHVAWFHPTRLPRLLTRRPKINFRTHRKIVVIDGRIGFTGGVNIEDRQDERHDPKAFHDVHLRLEGEAVSWLQLTFVEDWHYATTVTLDHPRYWPELEAGPVQAQVISAGPDTPWEPIHRLQVELIHAAQRRVWLATPYFVPGEAALFAVTSAAMRGLDVRLLLPEPHLNDSLLAAAAARSYYEQLRAAGVRIFHYQGRMIHTKGLVADDDEVVLGTSNFDHRSFRLNFEIALWLHDQPFTTTVVAQLERDFAASAEVVGESDRDPFSQRLLDSCARLLSPVL